jgi:RHS repeat-associated protein
LIHLRKLALILPALLIASVPVQATISRVQQNDAETYGSTTNSVTFTAAQTAGNLIVVALKFSDNATLVSLSDTSGNTFVLCGNEIDDTNQHVRARIYAAYNIATAAANSNTVTVTVSAVPNDDIRLWINEYSGAAISGPNDVNVGTFGTAVGTANDNITSGNATTSVANELLFGFVVPFAGPIAPGTGFTGISTSGGNLIEEQLSNSAGTNQATATDQVNADTYIMMMATFTPASTGAVPNITSLSPTSGAIGSSVTITGTNFGTTPGTVRFNGTAVTQATWGSPSITVQVPAGATTGNVLVTVAGLASNGVKFTILTPINRVQQNDAETVGSTTNSVTFTGAQTAGSLIVVALKFSDNATFVSLTDTSGNTYVQCGNEIDYTTEQVRARIYAAYNIASAAANSNTVTLTVSTVPNDDIRLWINEYSGAATSGANDVNAATFGAAAGTGNDNITSGTATTSVANELLFGFLRPFSGPGIAGTGFTSISTSGGNLIEEQLSNSAGTNQATATDHVSGDLYIMMMATFKPAGGGSAAPSIASLSPTSGAVGTSVMITGTNFGSSQGTSTVTFNGTSATPCPTCWSATSITVTVPSAATTGNVVVTVGGVASNGVAFTVGSAPTITSFSPASASIGTLISVTGTNFNANNAIPVVTLNQRGGGTIPASVSGFSATNVSFVIPTGAATGPITVTANGLNAVSSTSLTVIAASSFTLNATPGTITLLPGQTTTLDVTLASTNGFTQLAALAVSGLPSGVTAAFQPPQITAGQFSILTLTVSSGQAPSASGLTITASATVQGIAASSSANVTLQVQGTSGVAFAGRVAVTDAYSTPLVSVTVRMMGVNQTGVSTGCTGSTTSDGSGNFVLNGLSASCAGGQLIQYDPSTVTAPSPGSYSGVTLSYQLTSGQVTTPGIIVHLPRVDNAETFSVQQNASVDQTFNSASIPGVTITVYAGTTLSKADGTQPSPFPLSVIEIPYDRLPELMPPNPTQDPVFAMSIEPFNSSSNQPVAVSFPNRSKLRPGTGMPLTSLNPTMGMMVNYGTASVSPNGSQVIPDYDSAHPGHRFGISHFDWHFPLPGPSPISPCPKAPGVNGGCPKAADPIDLASGLFTFSKTDIVFGGARGQVGITRVFRGATINPGPFGIGTNHNYGYLLDTTNASTGQINLLMPDGNQFPFVQSGNTFVNSTIPSLQGAVINNVSCGFITSFGTGCSGTLRLKNGTTYQFQPLLSGQPSVAFLVSITDSNGNNTTLVHSSSAPNEIIQIVDPVGRSLNLTYDSSQHITSITDPIGRVVRYTYTPQGYLQTVTDANTPAGVTTYGYDTNNNLQTITDARNIEYLTNTYDSNGRVIQQQTADGAVTRFAYTLANATIPTSPVLLTTVTDPLGNQTTYHFNPSGFLLDVTDALGRETVFTLDSGTNLLRSTTDPMGRQTVFTYDSAGNTTSVQVIGIGQNATSASFTYEPIFNKLATITDPLNHTTSFSYDKAGNLIKAQDPLNPPATFGYDGAGELTTTIDPVGNPATQISYDGFGNLAQITDPLGRKFSKVSDAVGRAQNLSTALGQVTQYQYSPLNQITQITDPLNGETSFAYDPNGNLSTVTDALGSSHITAYSYDNMDRVATRIDSLGHTESYRYNLNGNLVQFTDRRGKVTTLQYDSLNRITLAGFGGRFGPPYESTISYSYDAGNRLIQVDDSITGTISRSYDSLDRLTSEVTPRGSVSYAYDAAERRTSMSVSGQSPVNYTFDNANRLTQISQGSSSVSFGYDNDSRRTSLTLPNSVALNYGYDAASQLTAITYTLGSNALGSLTYTYDVAGRRTGAAGSYARTGTPQAASSASYNVNNQLTQWKGASLTYDANGNLTSDGTNTYTWNARNQLVGISGGVSASFQYDPFGRRVSKTIGGTTQFLYDGENPVQEISGTTASANLLTGGMDEYFQRTDSAGARNFLTDALGGTLALADSTGTLQTQYTYEPFGNTTLSGTASTSALQYTGRENDGTGLYFYRARYYSPGLQRFVSEDQARLDGGPNFYTYAENNPISATDPSGNLLKWDHHDITYQAARDAGWSPRDAETLAQAVVNVDNLTGSQEASADAANMHAMAGRKPNGNMQSCTEGFRGSRDLLLKDVAQNDLDGLSKALHIIQDSNSPSHMGWQPWDGGSTIYVPTDAGLPSVPFVEHVPTVGHMIGDLFPGEANRSQALAMSTSLLREVVRAAHGGDPINPASYFSADPCGKK